MSNPNFEQLDDSSGGNDLRDSSNEEGKPFRGLMTCYPEYRQAGDAATIKEFLDCILTEKAALLSREQQDAYDDLIFEMVKRPNNDPIKFGYVHIVKILETVKKIFKSESPLIECDPAITVVGDLHGSWKDLRDLYNGLKSPLGKVLYYPAHQAHSFLFLGNYVDYGNQSLEVLMLLFCMKISQQHENKVIMLRGNHETREMNYKHGFRDELLRKFDKWMADDLFDKFNDVFNHMPLACLIGGQYLCVHGGIAPKLKSLDDIRKIPKPLECVEDNELACDLLWADYKEEVKGFKPNKDREISVVFGRGALVKTLDRLGVQAIFRSHQKMREGFEHHGRLLTITSFIDLEKHHDTAAFVRVPATLTAVPSVKVICWPVERSPLDSDEENARETTDAKNQTEEEVQKVQSFNVEGGEFAVEVVDE